MAHMFSVCKVESQSAARRMDTAILKQQLKDIGYAASLNYTAGRWHGAQVWVEANDSIANDPHALKAATKAMEDQAARLKVKLK